MLGAIRATVKFCCPMCGTDLRAATGEGEPTLDCPTCGERIRVPHQPHPFESAFGDEPTVELHSANLARSGCRLLQISVFLSLIEWSAAVAAILFALKSPTATLSNFVPLWIGVLAIIFLRSALRWAGYHRCESLARPARVHHWLFTARIAAILSALGFAAASVPLTVSRAEAEAYPVVALIAQIGRFLWCAGVALECGVLFAWFRLLYQFAGTRSTCMVTRYAVASAIAVLTFTAGLCTIGMLVILTVPRTDPPTRLTSDAVPMVVWGAVAVLSMVSVAFLVRLNWQYYRMLATLRMALPGR